jgi:hypothetical protein
MDVAATDGLPGNLQPAIAPASDNRLLTELKEKSEAREEANVRNMTTFMNQSRLLFELHASILTCRKAICSVNYLD